MTNKLEIYCSIHDKVKIVSPTKLMNNNHYGCDECSREAQALSARLTDNDILQEYGDTLPDNITIKEIFFDDIKRCTLINIECERHGEQQIRMSTLKKSKSVCPKCGKESTGYTSYKLSKLINENLKGIPTYLGVMLVEVFGISTLKVGVTTRSLEERYKWYLKEIFFSVQMSEVDAYILENQIHRKFSKKHDLRVLMQGMRDGKRWSGDTECYFLNKKDEIIAFAKTYFERTDKGSYAQELTIYEIPNFFPRDVSRDKSETKLPMPVVGVNPNTNEVEAEFLSISEANKAGYKNVSSVLSEKNRRQFSGGLRWFKKELFDKNNIPKLKSHKRGKLVRCLETGIVYKSITEAAKHIKSQGIPISGSHISSVCKGRRKSAGGFGWGYV